MLDLLIDSAKDTVRVVPVIFALFLIVDSIMIKLSARVQSQMMSESTSVVGGSLLGLIPQCGVPVGMAKLYSKSYIGAGALIAVFLSSSDEALIILSAYPEKWHVVLSIIASKVVIAIIFGSLIVRFFPLEKSKKHLIGLNVKEAEKSLTQIFIKSAKTTVKITVYLFITIFLIGWALHGFGRSGLMNALGTHSAIQPVYAALIGAIPSCMSSVVIMEGYLKGVVGIGGLMSGLLANTGYGVLILIRELPLKKSVSIITALLVISMTVGGIASAFGL